jgi:hypothetical protein
MSSTCVEVGFKEIEMAKKIFRRGSWPLKHDRELMMLAKTHTAQAIAEKFDRPVTTILKRAERLGLSTRGTKLKIGRYALLFRCRLRLSRASGP